MDALSEILRAVKLSGAMFFNAQCTEPWCVRSPPSQTFAAHIEERGSQVIEFHLIAKGRCYIRVGEETTPLEAGDIVMLPHGDAHYMGNGTGAAPIDSSGDLSLFLNGGLVLSQLGGGGEVTRLICGYLACEPRLLQPVVAGLPHIVRVHLRTDSAGEWLENSIHHAVNQAAESEPGSDAILARLAEVLFAETLRRYVRRLPPGRTGWLAGAGDPAVGRSLAAMHRKPAHPWTLDELAKEAGTSRSVLTDRFSRFLGRGPIAYLADWRLELAADALRASSRSVLQVATDVGYDSEAAFNRAFKRRFGDPPARYRSVHRARRPAV
jgi:AraC-like DNA-binding protein